MRIFLTVSVLLLLISGNVQAGSEYDRCIKEVKSLQAREASACSGFSYLVNPSGCFATQKALKEYTSTGKCKEIGIAEGVDFSSPPVIPTKNAGSTGSAGTVSPAAVKKSERELPQQENSCEQLKDENARLKAEINRLKAENERLTKLGEQ